MDPEVCERMRADWNRRAREDARYYVAFGRRGQRAEEFLATGGQLATGLARELKRLPPASPGRRSALEIGCGLGRLMRPLSAHFGEIHGVDVAEEMVRQAREVLRDIPHARVGVTSGADLAAFAGDSFDFVYSYAVFQHIPSREVVFQYLREARRVMKPGGVFRFQVNGLPETAAHYDTWSGVRIGAGEIAAFAREHDLQLLAVEGVSTQYMWVTMRKPPAGLMAQPASAGHARIRRITNAHTSEPVAPSRGRFAAVSLWLEGLPRECDLNSLSVWVGGQPARLMYLGPAEPDGLTQINFWLPRGIGTGLQPLRVFRFGSPVAAEATLRVIPPGPMVPRLVSVSDGIDLLSAAIVSGCVKVSIEELADPALFGAAIDGAPVEGIERFCTDPAASQYEFNFRVAEAVPRGRHELELQVGARRFAPVSIEVV